MRMSSPASRSICTVGVSVPADHRQAGHGTATSRPNWVWSCSDGCVLPDSTLVNVRGKPDAGNPLVRFDEGDQVQPWSLLYRLGLAVSPLRVRVRRVLPADRPARVRGRQPDAADGEAHRVEAPAAIGAH